MPPIATQANEIDACDSENAPVAAAATANLNVVRPDASFINASPSSTYISCLGMPARPASALTATARSEEHTSELQSLMRISYAVFCLKKKKQPHNTIEPPHSTTT